MKSAFKALCLDLSGVVYEGNDLLPGALDTIAKARESGITLRFVTNTATQGHTAILEKLDAMGLTVPADELFTAPKAAHAYLKAKGLRPYCLVHDAIRPEFDDLDQSAPNAVLMGDARDDLSYSNLNKAFQLCVDGAELIGIGMNRYFKNDGALQMDAGGFIRAVEWAANTEAVIMGKPGAAFFDQVVASTSYTAADCLMIGDDLHGDVIGAVDAGLQACLVQTGKYRPSDQDQLPESACCIANIGELFNQ